MQSPTAFASIIIIKNTTTFKILLLIIKDGLSIEACTGEAALVYVCFGQ